MLLKQIIVAALISTVTAGHADNGYTEKHCRTDLASTKCATTVPTVFATCQKTYTVRSTKFNQKTVTFTPKPVIKTTTKTSISNVFTTADVRRTTVLVVATASTTVTITSPTTIFETSTSTATSLVPSTSTVKAPDGFRPVQDSLPGVVMWGDSQAPIKRNVLSGSKPSQENQVGKRQPVADSLLTSNRGASSTYKRAKSYPKKVACSITSFVPKTIVVTTAMPDTTITASVYTSTITETTKRTTTHTVNPAGETIKATSTTTKTILTTEKPQTTVTSTATTTDKVDGPVSTIYEVCLSGNYADSFSDGRMLVNPSPGFSVREYRPEPVDSPFACCLRCYQTQGCAGASYQNGICTSYLAGTSDCNANKICSGTVTLSASRISSSNPGAGVVVINGVAMQWLTLREEPQ